MLHKKRPMKSAVTAAARAFVHPSSSEKNAGALVLAPALPLVEEKTKKRKDRRTRLSKIRQLTLGCDEKGRERKTNDGPPRKQKKKKKEGVPTRAKKKHGGRSGGGKRRGEQHQRGYFRSPSHSGCSQSTPASFAASTRAARSSCPCVTSSQRRSAHPRASRLPRTPMSTG